MLRDDTKENILASFVDMTSIFVAYNIGVSELGIGAGILYGLFDAWLVVWNRRRISNLVYRISRWFRSEKAALPWIRN